MGSPCPPHSSFLCREPFPATATFTQFARPLTHQQITVHPVWPRTYPLEQLALQEGLDQVVGGGEVPRLVYEVDGFEPGWEGILQ